jgi:adenosylcobinamide-phosphate synthase
MNFLSELPHFSQAVLIMLLVILFKWLLTRAIAHQPLHFFRFYCQRLASKVNKQSNPHNQQFIAGSLASIITFTPLIIILALFENLVALPWLWQGFLLYLAIDGLNINSENKKMAQDIFANQNYQAKQLLQRYVLRKTENLSATGLSKAAIEMQLLVVIQLLITPIFFYLTFGALAAISYRILLEMHYSWNIKRQEFQYYGRFINRLVALLQWLPCRLFSILMIISSLGNNAVLFSRLISNHFFKLNNNLPINLFALLINRKLGGVAIYDHTKLRRLGFNEVAQQPEPRDILVASQKITQLLIMLLMLVIFMAILPLISQL